jgi:hypothetical protein
MPPVARAQLPESLLTRFKRGSWVERLAQLLCFISPLSVPAMIK